MRKIKKPIKDVMTTTSRDVKISELIVTYASDYINMGESMEERQNYLNGACTAWNIANLPADRREEALHQAAIEYQRINPTVDDVTGYLHDMKLLIQKKVEMFPQIRKAIVGAFIEAIDDERYRINVVSTNDPGRLFNWR